MTVLDNLPFSTGNFVDDIRPNRLLMAFADNMIALINRIAEHLADYGTAPRIIAHFGFYRALDTGNGNLVFQQIFGDLHHAVSI